MFTSKCTKLHLALSSQALST